MNSSDSLTGNVSIDPYVWITESGHGPQTSENAIAYTIVYGLLLVLGVGGNITTIVVIRLSHRKRGWSGIDAYLLNLAAADLLLTLTGVPLEIYRHWRQYPWELGDFVCSGVAFVSESSLSACIITIMAFTFERFLAVRDPLKAFRSFSSHRTAKVIMGIWLIALVNGIPYAYFTSVNYLEDRWQRRIHQSAWCGIHYSINAQVAPLFIYSAVCFYIVPMITLTILYVRIGLLLRQTDPKAQEGVSQTETAIMPRGSETLVTDSVRSTSSRHEGKHAAESRRRSVQVLLAIVANFFFCYGLFHVQRLIFALVNDWHTQSTVFRHVYTAMFPISGFLYHANPVLDPILYSMMSKRFQIIYRQIFCCQLTKLYKDRRMRLANLSQITLRGDTLRRLQPTSTSCRTLPKEAAAKAI